jgi:hypothetical protein
LLITLLLLGGVGYVTLASRAALTIPLREGGARHRRLM